jgi:UDPglucose--hexose-1-phosphate uridylyltransferase
VDLEAALGDRPHRRYDPLADRWTLVSARRSSRPWQGSEEPRPADGLPPYDADCYLCPGNVRASGERNPDYTDTHVFTNDFAALAPDAAVQSFGEGLLRGETEAGTCRVICYSPRHDLALGAMSAPAVRRVVDLWADESARLGERYRWVQVFENRGESMGASNPHPHGQVWAGSALPSAAVVEERTQRLYRRDHDSSLLVDYAAQERESARVVIDEEAWLVVVPFWAAWPFETLLVAREPVAWLPDVPAPARDQLASVLVRLLAGYDALFDQPFPYSMGWHQAPFGGASGEGEGWQLHAHLYPPLLRATVRKFMVGYELLAEPQRDLTPEDAAKRLRAAVAAG